MVNLVFLTYPEKIKYKIYAEIFNMYRTDSEFNSIF